MSHLLIVGKKFNSLTAYLEANGHTYTLLQDKAATKFPDKKFKHRIVASFETKESILAGASQIQQPIDGVLTVYENYILPAAWVAEYLDLPGLPVAAGEACTDKYLMRSLFAKAPEKISPAFDQVDSENDVREFANAHSFPIILKPANLAKSLLVTKSSTLEELLANYRRSSELLQTTYKKYAPHRQPKMIIEEFLEGSIHSVDAFIDTTGTPHVLEQVVDYQTGYDIGYDDNFHYSRLLPSALSAEDQAALRHCAEVGIKALGMANSAAHVEVIMTKDGPRIVEIGARNGGYRERMHALANGIDIIGAAIDVAQGQAPRIASTKNEPCAVLELFPKTPGIYRGITNDETLRQLPSLVYLSVKAKEGAYIGKAADGHKMAAIVILHNENQEAFNQDLAYINANVAVVTEPSA
jgi:biotin carboxylase